ncbi:hypothetical protein [Bacillus andreraoultii]|uniref:hypothetical protein n=1 Tax=Bacillus andreraoultii TaxID=1499685 RepID=UPI0005398312|nr:hypothetical protein [Bacillus andreraoultii]
MKRYWKIIFVLLFTVVTIGIFYIQLGVSSSKYPQFEFKKISGDEKEVEDLIFHIDYTVGDLYYPLQVRNGITSSYKDLNFFEEVTRDQPGFEHLMKLDKSFLRRKTLDENNFYEDKNQVIYTDIKTKNIENMEFIAEVGTLNKKTKDKTYFEIDVPEKGMYDWIRVYDVQYTHGKVKVLTNAYNVDGQEEVIVYTIDLDKEKIADKQVLLKDKTTSESLSSSIYINNEEYSMEPSKYALIVSQQYEDKNVEDDKEAELISTEGKIYHYDTGELTDIKPKEKEATWLESASIYGSTVFTQKQTEKELEIYPYNIETDQWGDKIIFNVPHYKDKEEIQSNQPFITLKQGKIYIINTTDNKYSLYIGDLSTGDSLYEGKILIKAGKKEKKDYEVYFNLIQ